MFASEKVMLDYLSQLLTEEEMEKETSKVAEKVTPNSPEVKKTIVKVSEPNKVNTDDFPLNAPSATPRKTVVNEPVRQLKPITSSKSAPKPYKEAETVQTQAKPETEAVAKLLQQVELKQQEEKLAKEQIKTVDAVETETQVESQVEKKQQVSQKQETFPEEPFQALFFEVAGLQLAVPLQELGGIHNLTEVNSLFGKPDWFHGVMINREEKLSVVDSAKWVMPEKYDEQMEASLNYQYLIMLGESKWGLTAEKLVETELIQPQAVKWRTNSAKRPWLLGTIKEKMCALLHVSDLIAMLEQGVNARQE